MLYYTFLQLTAPNPVDVNTIKILTINNNHVNVTWKVSTYLRMYYLIFMMHIFHPQKPIFDRYLIPRIKFYNVSISSNNSELTFMKTTNTTITFMLSEYLEYQSNDSYIFTVVVVDNEEMRSQPTTKILGKCLSQLTN